LIKKKLRSIILRLQKNYERTTNEVVRELKEKHDKALEDLKLDKSNLTRAIESLQNQLRESNRTVNTQYNIYMKDDMRRINAEKEALYIKYETQQSKLLELEKELARYQKAYIKKLENTQSKVVELEKELTRLQNASESPQVHISFHGNKFDNGSSSTLSIDGPGTLQSEHSKGKTLNEQQQKRSET